MPRVYFPSLHSLRRGCRKRGPRIFTKYPYSNTWDLPGLALVITFFMHSDFSVKLQQFAMLFLSRSFHSQQPPNLWQLFKKIGRTCQAERYISSLSKVRRIERYLVHSGQVGSICKHPWKSQNQRPWQNMTFRPCQMDSRHWGTFCPYSLGPSNSSLLATPL